MSTIELDSHLMAICDKSSLVLTNSATYFCKNQISLPNMHLIGSLKCPLVVAYPLLYITPTRRLIYPVLLTLSI